MNTIEIDFDVYKALTLRRASEEVTHNDVLRELLKLGPKNGTRSTPPSPPQVEGDWETKGIRFPAGTEFRASYKGRTILGRVEGAALVVNGQRFDSPSAAAMSITGNAVNGWTFWECRIPGKNSWQMIKSVRR
jgi:hypothetical protein